MIRFDKNFAKQFVLLLLIRIGYSVISYKTLDGLWYSGTGGYDIQFSALKEVLGLLLYLINVVLLLKCQPSEYYNRVLINTIFMCYIIPVNASYGLNNTSLGYILLSDVYAVILILCSKVILFKKDTNDKLNSICIESLNKVFFVLCLLFIIYKVYFFGFNISFSLAKDEIYANRADSLEIISSYGGSIVGYLTQVLKGIIGYVAPVYFAISMLSKNFTGIIVSLVCIICIFSVTYSKSTFFLALILVVLYIYKKKYDLSKFHEHIRWIALITMFIPVFEKLAFSSNYFFMYIIRRTMYIPAWLNIMYYEYFSENTKLLFSNSAFGLQNIMPKVYQSSVLEIISEDFFKGYVASPNTGMFAEAYMQLGLMSFAIYPIIYVMFFNFSRIALYGFDNFILCAVVIETVIHLINIPILRTDFITSNVIFIILLYYSKVIRIKNNVMSKRWHF